MPEPCGIKTVWIPDVNADRSSRLGAGRRGNLGALLVVGAIAFGMFLVGIWGITSGQVVFPVDEYNEEATLQQQWIQGLVGETLEYVMPKTTEDAINFQSTLDVAPTRLYLYIRETATAIPKQGD